MKETLLSKSLQEERRCFLGLSLFTILLGGGLIFLLHYKKDLEDDLFLREKILSSLQQAGKTKSFDKIFKKLCKAPPSVPSIKQAFQECATLNHLDIQDFDIKARNIVVTFKSTLDLDVFSFLKDLDHRLSGWCYPLTCELVRSQEGEPLQGKATFVFWREGG